MTSRAGHVGLAKLAKPAKPGLGWGNSRSTTELQARFDVPCAHRDTA